MADFDPRQALRLQAGELADRAKYVPVAQASIVDEISFVVLFVMAFWSGPSRQAFHHLVRVITKHDSVRKLRIVVADIDGMQDFYEAAHFGVVERCGGGETFWVKDGKVVSKSGPRFNIECVEQNTVAILNETQ